MARFLGIDYGDVRIGLATGNSEVGVAHPSDVVKNSGNAVKIITGIIEKEHIDEVVVGLPRNMDGSEGFQAKAVREFAGKLAAAVDIRINFCDERLSSRQADTIVREVKGKSADKFEADAHQAAVILQSWLDELGES